MAKDNYYRGRLKRLLPDPSMVATVDKLSETQAQELLYYIHRPNLSLYADRTTVPFGLNVSTDYGSIHLNASLQQVDKVYVGGVAFDPVSSDIEVMRTLLDGSPEDGLIPQPRLMRPRGRGRRIRRYGDQDRQAVPFEEVAKAAQTELEKARLSYNNFFMELSGVFDGKAFDVGDIMSELIAHAVDEKDIPHFLTHESLYKREVVSQLFGLNYGTNAVDYHFEPIQADDSFVGRLMKRLGVSEGEYDATNGVLRLTDDHQHARLITNLPSVDANGVFSNKTTRYIPYHIGYFEEGTGSRIERLRVIDPVEKALRAVALQYQLTNGDIKFKTLLDVSRNLPDFDRHPFGQELLDTYKKKVVLDKSYAHTNSLLAEYQHRADDLGAVATAMLDDEAKGLIDPLGTSNGANMGYIFYLTKDAQFNPDGTLTKGKCEYSPVGEIMKRFHIDKDNFNRHQMSFNAFLTSTDVKVLNVAYGEFALWNAEDAVVLTRHGADRLHSEAGDKVTDMHGNKSVSSLIVDPEMDDAVAKKEQLTQAVAFARLNPEVDLVVSPVSLASRQNMGVAMEGLAGAKQDLKLPDGSVVKDGIVQIAYMTLPQTAEHKSKDYGQEGDGRRYSTLFHYALASKTGEDLYRKALIDDKIRDQHTDDVATRFGRLGVSFKDEQRLIVPGNVRGFVPAVTTVKASDYAFYTPAVIRRSLLQQMDKGRINIDLGDQALISPLTHQPIVDAQGRNVLPLRVSQDETIPYRYSELFKELSMGNPLQAAYNRAIAIDYKDLTAKDNILKNLDTMTFFEGAKTEMISPDPRLKLGQIATHLPDRRVIFHRDPCIQSGNVISMENIGGADHPNMTHVHPLVVYQVDGDFDSDTVGLNSYSNLHLTEEEKQTFFERSNVYEQLNYYGQVFLSTGSSHFQAAVLANGFDDSHLNFENGQSNEEVGHAVERLMTQIVDSPRSYGAYALSFHDEQALKDSLNRLADDGIKGNREDIDRHFDHGYTIEEDRAVQKALIAKSEWTGLAGTTTNRLIAGLGDQPFDAKLTRVAMDVTHAMTQSVLQMKKNADRLPEIDTKISQMKAVMSGSSTPYQAEKQLLAITDGLAPKAAIQTFVQVVNEKQRENNVANGLPVHVDGQSFGEGVIHSTEASNTSFAFMSDTAFERSLAKTLTPLSEASDNLLSEEEFNRMAEAAQDLKGGASYEL